MTVVDLTLFRYLNSPVLVVGQLYTRSRLNPLEWHRRVVVARAHAVVVYKEDMSEQEVELFVPVEDIVHVVPFDLLEAAPFDADEHPWAIECCTRGALVGLTF